MTVDDLAPGSQVTTPADGVRSSLNRRDFLRTSGSAGLLAAAAVGSSTAWTAGTTVEAVAPAPPIIVLLTLYGGNDGLNTVVPHSDPTYLRIRSGLAYRAGEVTRLDGRLGLNPSLSAMARSWRAGQLAVVNGVGHPGATTGHARSMRIWQTGSLDAATETGWVGRWLDTTSSATPAAVQIGRTMAPLGRGATRSATLAASAAGAPGLGAQLAAVSAMIRAGSPSRLYSVSMGGFDTHTGGRKVHQDRLATLDKALGAFDSSLAENKRAGGVITVVYSEFGRQLAPNRHGGTDHGTVGPVLVRGARVKGGLYGEQVLLSKYTTASLPIVVDFRTVLAELIERGLAGDPRAVLGRNDELLGFLR